MSKLLTISVAVVALSAASLFAATPTAGAGTTANHGTNFVDKDGDGLCDNVGTRQGSGKGTGCQSGTGCGANFVDANKDGVCDNAGTKKGSGQGMKRGQGKGKGCCGVQSGSK
ncbi:MAG: hypothetical protein JNL74_04855 [Fibrobacteres bacterium]|nr:hypothetical protein [Fibrobacterota bacterium]